MRERKMRMPSGRRMYPEQSYLQSRRRRNASLLQQCPVVINISIPNMSQYIQYPKMSVMQLSGGYFPTRNSADPYASKARLKSVSSSVFTSCVLQGHWEG